MKAGQKTSRCNQNLKIKNVGKTIPIIWQELFGRIPFIKSGIT